MSPFKESKASKNGIIGHFDGYTFDDLPKEETWLERFEEKFGVSFFVAGLEHFIQKEIDDSYKSGYQKGLSDGIERGYEEAMLYGNKLK